MRAAVVDRWRAWRTVWPVLGVLVLLALAWWVAIHLERHEVERYRPPQGAALRDEHYVLREWLRRVGVTLETPQHRTLPPPSATLVLTDAHWDVSRQHRQAVREWVRAGGHVVLYTSVLEEDAHPQWLADWQIKTQHHLEALEKLRPEGASSPEAAPASRCFPLTEAPGLAESRTGRVWHKCDPLPQVLTSPRPLRWGLRDALGWRVLRWAEGAGRVTVIGDSGPTVDIQLLRDDQAALVSAAWDVRPGQPVWLWASQDQPNLWHWLWRHAAPVMVLGGLAVALALWRAMPRLGPWRAALPTGRRGAVAQVRGTAAFLLRRDPAALHAAQVQALNHTVTRCLPASVALDPTACWAEVARRTAQDETLVRAALAGPGAGASSRAWASSLLTLEHTRRRLLHAPSSDSPVTSSADHVPHA